MFAAHHKLEAIKRRKFSTLEQERRRAVLNYLASDHYVERELVRPPLFPTLHELCCACEWHQPLDILPKSSLHNIACTHMWSFSCTMTQQATTQHCKPFASGRVWGSQKSSHSSLDIARAAEASEVCAEYLGRVAVHLQPEE